MLAFLSRAFRSASRVVYKMGGFLSPFRQKQVLSPLLGKSVSEIYVDIGSSSYLLMRLLLSDKGAQQEVYEVSILCKVVVELAS